MGPDAAREHLCGGRGFRRGHRATRIRRAYHFQQRYGDFSYDDDPTDRRNGWDHGTYVAGIIAAQPGTANCEERSDILEAE